MTKTEQELELIIKPVVEKLGYELYDVEYLKEGSSWFLRVYIDSENGIDLDDCEKVSGEVGEKLDEVDPISTEYNLEVSSCGLERHLREIKHYKAAEGNNIEVKFFKVIEGIKSCTGKLVLAKDDEIILDTEDGEKTFKIADISSAKILFNWEELENE